LGIGTTSPDRNLHIESAVPGIRLSDTTENSYGEILYNVGDLQIRSDQGNTEANSTIVFDVDGSERMRIDSSGALEFAGTAGRIDLRDSDVDEVLTLSHGRSVKSINKSVSTTATTLFASNAGLGGFAIIFGQDGINRFVDYILVGRTSGSVQASFNFVGVPASRTYTVVSFSELQLSMSSGTYSVQGFAFYPNTS